MTNALNNNSILPALALYGNTVNYSFPLILILGREPNDEGNIENTIGLYDFDDSPRSAFWNRAYSFIHRHSEVVIKKNVIELNNSPIIFANASPKAILNSEAAKIEKRAEVSQKEIEDHINSVFGFNLINRVNLIILSGLSGAAIFEFATRQIIHHAKRHNIPLTDENIRVLKHAVEDHGTDRIRDHQRKLDEFAVSSAEAFKKFLNKGGG